MRRWRLTTWLLLAWSIFGVVWISTAADQSDRNCEPFGESLADACTTVESAHLANHIWVLLVGFVVLYVCRRVGGWLSEAGAPRCPSCGAEVQEEQEACGFCDARLPSAVERKQASQRTHEEMSEPEVKTCPDCAEEVKAAARVCRHCGYRFDSDGGEPPAGSAPGLNASTTVPNTPATEPSSDPIVGDDLEGDRLVRLGQLHAAADRHDRRSIERCAEPLKGLLRPDESIEAVVVGSINRVFRCVWAATDTRLVCVLDLRRVDGFYLPYEDVHEVSYSDRLGGSVIYIRGLTQKHREEKTWKVRRAEPAAMAAEFATVVETHIPSVPADW